MKDELSLIPEASESFIHFPVNLRTEAFAEAWADWTQFRKERRQKLTATTIKYQMRMLSEWGEERAITAIHHTITQGWQGLREPDSPTAGKSTAKSFAPSLHQQVESTKALLADVNRKLTSIGVPSDLYPDRRAAIIAKRTPLLNDKQRLVKRLTDLNTKISNGG